MTLFTHEPKLKFINSKVISQKDVAMRSFLDEWTNGLIGRLFAEPEFPRVQISRTSSNGRFPRMRKALENASRQTFTGIIEHE
jgi:hypothetical protein